MCEMVFGRLYYTCSRTAVYCTVLVSVQQSDSPREPGVPRPTGMVTNLLRLPDGNNERSPWLWCLDSL